MEDRSSRRMRTLVTRMAHWGLSADEIAGALISMIARSATNSNQRPDTLMQDRPRPTRRKPLAAHGRAIHLGHLRKSPQSGPDGRLRTESGQGTNHGSRVA